METVFANSTTSTAVASGGEPTIVLKIHRENPARSAVVRSFGGRRIAAIVA
jgi:hypothetical protein